MKFTAKYILLVVAALALVALWYLKREGYIYEGFAEQEKKEGSKNIFENFNDAQKDLACKTIAEQIKLYSDMMKNPASTDQDKEMQAGISKTIETLKAEQMKQACPPM